MKNTVFSDSEPRAKNFEQVLRGAEEEVLCQHVQASGTGTKFTKIQIIFKFEDKPLIVWW